ncbi:MAG: LAGLIDADG family homing endonuclease [Candidatus Diapherotrites archaeon]|nr:LAGLIDADG family homing endonuclease [Candidatus Diapherotrites archaeon]
MREMTIIESGLRVEAFNAFMVLKESGLPRKEIFSIISTRYGITVGSLYAWYHGTSSPFGKKRLKHCPELFYILGALIGDGYVYSWKQVGHKVGVIGEEDFIKKYAGKISACIGRPVKGYINRSNNTWFVVVGNVELFFLFKQIRKDFDKLFLMLGDGDCRLNALQLIEGFFDAEGCVKVIKEKSRKTPKICLDLCNTNYNILEIIRKLLEEQLQIISRYSIQKSFVGKDGSPRKKIYHLRIYKKSFVRTFFENIGTCKLKPEKICYVQNWLGRGANAPTALHFDNSRLLVSSSQCSRMH